MVKIDDDSMYCLQHTIKYLTNSRIKPTQCKLIYAFGIEEIEQMLEGLRERIVIQQKKQINKKQTMQQRPQHQQSSNHH